MPGVRPCKNSRAFDPCVDQSGVFLALGAIDQKMIDLRHQRFDGSIQLRTEQKSALQEGCQQCRADSLTGDIGDYSSTGVSIDGMHDEIAASHACRCKARPCSAEPTL